MKNQSLYYIENQHGQVIRAIPLDSKNTDFLYIIFREDTRRMEVVSDLTHLNAKNVKYQILESLNKDVLKQKGRHNLTFTNSELVLVEEVEKIKNDVSLPEDDTQKFLFYLKRTAAVSFSIASILFIISLFNGKTKIENNELQVIQVVDREKLQPTKIVSVSEKPVSKTKVVSRSVQPQKLIVKNLVKNQFARKKAQSVQLNQVGALAVLGNVKNSTQKGGLRLDQAQVSRGPGRGGNQGSGGVQTAVYSKGLFAAPVGLGNRADGAGGYGTKGKGGGQGGYGEIKLAGSAGSFFEPIENEVWTEGGLDRNEIAAVIRRHESEIRFCYEKGLQKNPRLSGRVSMKFLIGPNGQVTTAQIANSSLNFIPSESCIRDRLKSWKFPKPQGGVTVKVNYPFVLRRVTDS